MSTTTHYIASLLAIVTMLPAFASGATAQELQRKKIPYEVIEGPAPAGEGDESSAPRRKHLLALGVNIDPFHTVLSAVDREFGLCVQPWFGVDNFRIRLDIAHFRVPDDIVATRYFYRNNVNVFALVLEYTFGARFDGFLIGGGIGLWQDSVKHRFYKESSTAVRPYLTVEGGYIWKFHKNIYIEPCLALDILLTRPKLSVMRCGYRPLPVAGEITLKFGMYIDI